MSPFASPGMHKTIDRRMHYRAQLEAVTDGKDIQLAIALANAEMLDYLDMLDQQMRALPPPQSLWQRIVRWWLGK